MLRPDCRTLLLLSDTAHQQRPCSEGKNKNKKRKEKRESVDLVGGRSELLLKLGIKMIRTIAPARNVLPHVKGVRLHN